MAVHCLESGWIGLYIPDDQEISGGPRDVPRTKPEGHLEGQGKSWGRRGVQPNTSRFEAVYGHSLIINSSLGMYQEIHPCRASSIDSVKINTSLQMMRECFLIFIFLLFDTSYTIAGVMLHVTSTFVISCVVQKTLSLQGIDLADLCLLTDDYDDDKAFTIDASSIIRMMHRWWRSWRWSWWWYW